jgi:hypothetical protein
MPARTLGDLDQSVDDVLRADGLTDDADRAKLLEAIKLAAEDEFLGSMVGSEPVPTAMGGLRALRLRRICQYLERALSAHEIAAIFRVSTRQAVRLHDQMESTYPLLSKQWQLAAVARSADEVKLPVKTPANKAAEIVVTFKRREGPQAADRLIERAGLRAKATVEEFRVIVPIGDPADEAHDLVKETLGLKDLHAKSIEAARSAGRRRRG